MELMKVKASMVIPTLGMCPEFRERFLRAYEKYENIGEIIVVDNTGTEFDKNSPQESGKLRVYPQKTNLYVNQSWNLGAERAEHDVLMLMNDDIFASEEAINYAITLVLNNQYDILMSKLFENVGGSKIPERVRENGIHDMPLIIKNGRLLGAEHLGAGCFVTLKKNLYTPIPESIKIYFGDDFLLSKSNKPGLVFGSELKGFLGITCRKREKISDHIYTVQNDWIGAYEAGLLYREELNQRIYCKTGAGSPFDSNGVFYYHSRSKGKAALVFLRMTDKEEMGLVQRHKGTGYLSDYDLTRFYSYKNTEASELEQSRLFYKAARWVEDDLK